MINPLKTYDWGSKESIPAILGQETGTKPIAELWMSAHPSSPSKLILDTKSQSLEHWIAEDPINRLGTDAASQFQGKLPFLLKILAAAKPLSIQAHPNEKQALKGFQRENHQNIPLAAAERTYKDPHHKPELICALTPFEALNGFRPWNEIHENFSLLQHKGITQLIKAHENKSPKEAIKGLFIDLINQEEHTKTSWAKYLHDWANNQKNHPLKDVIISTYHFFPGDIGIFTLFMLNYVVLQPGQAMFLNSCRFHAYLKGTGIEIMANSDNVLRAGLTKKHVNIPELAQIIDFQPSRPEIQSTAFNSDFTEYHSEAKEFQLLRFDMDGKKNYSTHNGEILLVVKGQLEILNQSEKLLLNQGESVFLCPRLKNIRFQGRCLFFIARINPLV